MSTETTKKKIKIDNGTEFARVYTDKEMDSKLSGLSSDTAVITLSDAQVQSLSQFNITFTQEQATLLEKATSFKFYYAGTEIAHGQCGKFTSDNTSIYGLSMILSNLFFTGTNPGMDAIADYKQLITLQLLSTPDTYIIEMSIAGVEDQHWLNISTYKNNTTSSENYYFSSINGSPILSTHPQNVKNYDLGKSINLFGNHSILVPNASTDTEINLYNHFIKITGTKDTTQVIARFTIQSSNNLVVDSLTDLYTLLGNEFEIGCSGLFGENNLVGLRKTTEGVLELIYNNGGAESLKSVAGLTISISDKVKTV